MNSHKYCSTKFADCKAFAAKKGIKFQNHLNLNIAIKALLFIFKNKGMGLDFLYTFFTCFIFISSSYNFFYNIMLIMLHLNRWQKRFPLCFLEFWVFPYIFFDWILYNTLTLCYNICRFMNFCVCFLRHNSNQIDI